MISPLLFVIYVDELLTNLTTSQTGIYNPHTNSTDPGKMFMDDQTLLATGPPQLDTQFGITRLFSAEHGMVINTTKTTLSKGL